jgi:glyoxylase-like metal-dependent hydrolase (beta-lactamase superfamily II)
MKPDYVNVLRDGDPNGNGMLIRFDFPGGLSIVGLPTENHYGGDWDLGPTWNYLILGDSPFLVDTGRFTTAKRLLSMIEATGHTPADISFIVLTHGHEDHDGGVAELAGQTRSSIRAHMVYDRLIRFYPDKTPETSRPDFPANCWHCFMPESFYKRHCLEYQKANSTLSIHTIDEPFSEIAPGVQCLHVPGHSPDCLAILVNHEVLLVGDTVLPQITPWPTTEKMFQYVAPVFSSENGQVESFHGLKAYLKSLYALKKLASTHPDLVVLPAHRLYYGGQWNGFQLAARIDELVAHHITRLGDILQILDRKGPLSAKDIAFNYFNAGLLKGFGINMAENEILSHLELLIASGNGHFEDDVFVPDSKDGFEDYITMFKTLSPFP